MRFRERTEKNTLNCCDNVVAHNRFTSLVKKRLHEKTRKLTMEKERRAAPNFKLELQPSGGGYSLCHFPDQSALGALKTEVAYRTLDRKKSKIRLYHSYLVVDSLTEPEVGKRTADSLKTPRRQKECIPIALVWIYVQYVRELSFWLVGAVR